jgi:hypothetical protein
MARRWICEQFMGSMHEIVREISPRTKQSARGVHAASTSYAARPLHIEAA